MARKKVVRHCSVCGRTGHNARRHRNPDFFTDKEKRVHPIRRSAGYSRKTAGERSTKKTDDVMEQKHQEMLARAALARSEAKQEAAKGVEILRESEQRLATYLDHIGMSQADFKALSGDKRRQIRGDAFDYDVELRRSKRSKKKANPARKRRRLLPRDSKGRFVKRPRSAKKRKA